MAELARLSRTTGGASAQRPRRAAPHLRYMGFLSYSHQDAAIADWLHEALEQFRVPPRLVGRLTEHGPVPKRLAPIFRDRGELAAAHDLSEEIEEAIEASRFLIVLCSPAAARSRWINEEIACFKRLHREDRILAAIVDGEPFASDTPGHEAEECFPAALRIQYDRRGRPTTKRAEPIAADLREEGDGRKMGLLKLAAGMVGVGLDDLAQRETQRRHRRLYLLTAASVAGMLFASGLAYTAIDARDEARDQRREAESLVGFMLGDLRAKLEPVGRLDVLDAVGARALAFYEKQDTESLSDEALVQRSQALTLMGEIAAARGDLDGALRRYRAALAGTAEALHRSPGDPQRLFNHAQSVFYVGETASQRGRIDEAASRFREYRNLADRMIAADPDNPKWRLEGIYAATNLGRIELKQRRYADAAATFEASVGATDLLTVAGPDNPEFRELLLEALAYWADALDNAGQLEPAIQRRERQLTLLAPLLAQKRPDANLRQKAMITHLALARLRYQFGETDVALRHAATAVALGRSLIALEPSNADWTGRSVNTLLAQALLLLRSGKTAEAAVVANEGCDLVGQLTARDPSVDSWRVSSRNCLALRAELAVAGGTKEEALLLARQALKEIRYDPARRSNEPFALAQAHKLAGDILWRAGDRNGAAEAWKSALASWPRTALETPREQAERSALLRGTGARAEGDRIAERLMAMGYRQSLVDRVKI